MFQEYNYTTDSCGLGVTSVRMVTTRKGWEGGGGKRCEGGGVGGEGGGEGRGNGGGEDGEGQGEREVLLLLHFKISLQDEETVCDSFLCSIIVGVDSAAALTICMVGPHSVQIL